MTFTRKGERCGVSVAGDRSMGENKDGPSGAINTGRGLTSSSESTRKEADAIMLEHQSDRNPEPRPGLFEASRRIQDPAPADRHWFVPDAPDGFYCAACALPVGNRRHISRRENVA